LALTKNTPTYVMVYAQCNTDQSCTVDLHSKHQNGDWNADKMIS